MRKLLFAVSCAVLMLLCACNSRAVFLQTTVAPTIEASTPEVLNTKTPPLSTEDLFAAQHVERDPVVQNALDAIYARVVINEADMQYISDVFWEGMIDDIRDYNEKTDVLYQHFLDNARVTVTAVATIEGFGSDKVFTERDWPYPFTPEQVNECAARIAHYSLYRDCVQRMLDDPVIYTIYSKEAGGSAGLWISGWTNMFLDDNPEIKEMLADYYQLTDKLLLWLRQIQPR